MFNTEIYLVCLDHVCGKVASVLTFYCDYQSSNTAESFSLSVQSVFEKDKNKQKEAGDGLFKKSIKLSVVGSR